MSSLTRRQFVGAASGTALALLASRGEAAPQTNEFVFLEAEGFADLGGWVVDQQSMDQMGSPYVLAHGLGRPVADAVTQVAFPSAGRYRVWVRTRDWVAPWNAPGAPGKFQLLIDGVPVNEVFGTKGADWHWHDGGIVAVPQQATIALHDLTGFEGRCEAVLFCKDTDFEPVNDVQSLDAFRRELLGLPAEELLTARDDCGAPTLQLQLAQMALLFAHLGAGAQPDLERLSRAMLAHPDLVAGEGRFDTELMRRGLGQVLSKGGAEGIQCLSRVGEGLGLAIKVEDGASRAKHAVALHLMRQLEWLTPTTLDALGQQFLHPNEGVKLEVSGELRFDNGR